MSGTEWTGTDGPDSILGGDGADSILGLGGPDTIVAGGRDDLRDDGAGDDSLDGGAGLDTLSFALHGDDDITRAPDGTLVVAYRGNDTASAPGPIESTDTVADAERLLTRQGAFDLATPEQGVPETLVLCFAAGTRIMTASGEILVEQLRPRHRVVTLGGRGLPVKPVVWVGRRHLRLAGHPRAAEMAPIRVKAGALADHAPMRDLLVSPDHGLHLDGVLVSARLLVNGTTITVETGLAEVTWYHVELETHEILVADGAAAESWLDCGNRAWFENAQVALLSVPGNLDEAATRCDTRRACRPVVRGGPRLAAIRDALAARAAALAQANATPLVTG